MISEIKYPSGNIRAILGTRLRMYRNAKQYSLEELAFRADMEPNHLGKIERNERNFTVGTLDRIVEALEISYQELFSYENAIIKPENPLINKTASYMAALNVKEQEHIYKTARMLYAKKKK